jgi:endonuclease/exonuclease/phosphatase family metal-dependent hydrolase
MISTYLRELEILVKASPKNCPTIILGDFNYINKGRVTPWPHHIYIKKYLKTKEGIMETQIFHHAKLYLTSKNPLKNKETKILQGIIITL